MKKSIFFSSLLALAACGGGSGGGSNGGIVNPGGDIIINPSFGSVSEDVKASNAEILTINSTVSDETKRTAYLQEMFGDEYDDLMAAVQETDTPILFALNRNGSLRANSNNNICKSERDCNQLVFDKMLETLKNLENINSLDQKAVRYALIAAGFKDDLPGHWDDIKAYIKEHKDEIESKAEDVYNTPGQGMPEEIRLDGTLFSALITTGASDLMKLQVDDEGKVVGVKFEDVGSGSSKYSPAKLYAGLNRIGDTDRFEFDSQNTSGELIMESYAKELGLQYTDFGTFTAAEGTTISGRDEAGAVIPFVGGYLAKNISTEDLKEDVTFKGIAKGMVNPANETGAVDLGIEDKNATLAFNKTTGEETFSASFSNWYDVKLVNKGDRVQSFEVNDAGREIDGLYQLKNPPLNAGEDEVVSFEKGYFGDSGIPEEAVMLLQYQQHVGQTKDDGNLNVFIGFGGKAQ